VRDATITVVEEYLGSIVEVPTPLRSTMSSSELAAAAAIRGDGKRRALRE
jgi:hypothetical protein